MQTLFDLTLGEGPLVAVANHAGEALRDEVAELMALDPGDRLREEDPFTDRWAEVVPTRLLMRRSRFEVDLNRDRGTAVYLTPEDAWGLKVWRRPLPAEIVARSLAQYDAFYRQVHQVFSDKVREHRAFVALDLHSYNHRRDGPGAAADPDTNPEVNVGTGTMDRRRWGSVVDRFISDLRSHDFLGRHLDVRENVKFVGREFPRWTHERFPQSGCTIAVEFKKFFMDEWTGELDREQDQAIQDALRATLPGLREELARLGARV